MKRFVQLFPPPPLENRAMVPKDETEKLAEMTAVACCTVIIVTSEYSMNFCFGDVDIRYSN